jgi:hypothetical protein
MMLAARESRRMLAVDVRVLVWQEKRYDVEKFLRTGQVIEWGTYGVPDTPAMREAKAEVEREREMHRQAGRG